MELTVYWTQFAEDKLDDIYAYYSIAAGIQIAQKLVGAIIDKSLLLEKNPYIGQREPMLSESTDEFRYLIFKSYKIIYRVNHEKLRIEVVNLFDCRQNPAKIDKI